MSTGNNAGKTLSEEESNYLKELYANPSKVGSLGGLQSLYRAVAEDGKYNLTHKQIANWLKSDETYSLHRQVKRKFPRNRVVVGEINQQWDIDIADMSKLSKANKGYKYFLLTIDILSKYVRTVPLKSKSASAVNNAFKKMLSNKQVIPQYLRSDRGTEFTNQYFQKLVKNYKIKHFYATTELKSNVAERAIKTIKLKLNKYFTASQKLNWVDKLEAVTKTYNNSFHRSIKMKPVEATPSKTDIIWNNLYKSPVLAEVERYKFEINDKVRISYLKSTFERAYDYFWTGEIFTISERFIKGGLAKYRLKDYDNDIIKGSFYSSELQKVHINDQTLYKIEKLISRRVRNGVQEIKVKWLHWPSKYNSWVVASDLQKYK